MVSVLEGFRLGRDPSCLVLLDGEGVSRVHAEVERTRKGFVLRDAGSTNGTFLNGERIVEAAIEDGALVRFGGWLGVFERSSPGAPGGGVREIAPGLLGGLGLVEALDAIRRVAQSDLPIVVRGETGTGKEVVSRVIHEWSGRTGALCAVNCSALPQNLVEGELFGYRRGAFTGAERNSPGYFRAAHGGTLLLDEINELPLGVQAKLLRVLQERQVVPLGEVAPVNVDVRVIVAAQSPLSVEVAAGRFREDLYMRLKGLEVELPPLRARTGDAAELFLRFARQVSGESLPRIDAKLLEALCLYAWPGNVRELMLLTKRLLAVHGHEPVLGREHLPEEVTSTRPASAHSGASDPLSLLGKALLASDGNLTRACAALGISRQRAYRLLDGLSVEDLMARARDAEREDGG
jgi:transcriptional regulator with PAS, ATPase and Fis domain